MTNTNEKNTNDFFASIEKLKQDTKACRDFLKSKNISSKLDEALKKSFLQYEKGNNKGGFLRLLFDYDKEKGGWVKPSIFKKDIVAYFHFCNVLFHFNVKEQVLLIEYKKENIVSFLTYKEKVADIEKENKEKVKDNLLQVKLPFKISSLDKDALKACILQCKELLKQKEKENKN